MIEIKETIVKEVIYHQISNDERRVSISNQVVDFDNEWNNEVIKKIFLKPFSLLVNTFEFKHEIDIELNPLYKISKSIFENDNFVEKTKDVFQHLKTVSKHPNIKDGDLIIIKYEDVILADTYYEALGIYKIENKDDFIETNSESNELNFRKGISGRKLDKACLIVFGKKPYTVFIIDNAKTETDYWVNEFLNIRPKDDASNNTKNILELTKNFIVNELSLKCDFSKADQVELLNKSLDYFKTQESFDMMSFANTVIKEPNLIKEFQEFQAKYENENQVVISSSFNIADSVVKKQVRNFKKIINLDNNVQITIKANKNKIEQGIDNNGRKFYKIFYQEEK